jgi:peptidoglycan/LPS O-acetylase OafA/YrhL
MNIKGQKADVFSKKSHFQILDGLRGIAAVSVVIFHFMEFAVPDYHHNFIAHSYLAVDFFFCLSGFVIAYAYDAKIKTIGVLRFLKLRIIRLHPLVLIGAVIGILAFMFDPLSDLFTKYGSGQAALLFLSSALLIPYPLIPERYFNLFHLNPPTWSLFWEYIANIFYALVLVRLKNKLIWLLIFLAAIAICYEAYRSTFLGVGWGGDNFWAGGIRVSYSFLAGVLIYRSGLIITSRLGFISLSALLVLAFIFPYSDKRNFIIDPIIVVFYLPFLVSLGAGAVLHPRLSRICQWSGELSYPLYMVHYPFLWLFLSYVERTKPSVYQMVPIIIIGTVLLIGLAYLVLIYIDKPIRRYLSKRA